MKNFIQWLALVFHHESLPAGFTGALLDTRDNDVKKEDIQFGELVATADAVTWPKREWSDFRRFPVQDQSTSLSCVCQTMRKMLRVLFKVNRGLDLDFSASYLYRQRSNYPNGGTMASDVFKITRDGATLNALMPSDLLSESDMNNVHIEQYHREVAHGFQAPYHVELPAGNLETIASVIQKTGKAVMVWFYFNENEWSRDVPVVIDSSLNSAYLDRALRHSVTAVDFGIYNGEKGIFIEDSAHFGDKYERFVTEKFFTARNFYSAYPINFSFEPGGNVDPNAVTRPKYNPTSTKSLQDCLKFEGLFPANIESTGVFGAVTTKAVKEFQKKYNLEQVGTVGPLTMQLLEKLYS